MLKVCQARNQRGFQGLKSCMRLVRSSSIKNLHVHPGKEKGMHSFSFSVKTHHAWTPKEKNETPLPPLYIYMRLFSLVARQP